MARLPSTCSLLLCVLLSGVSLGAQSVSSPPTPAAPVSDAQALALLNSAYSGLAGPSKTLPTSLVATGTYAQSSGASDQSSPQSIRIETSGPSSFRSDLSSSSGTVTNIINGTSGWTQNSSGGRALAVGETFGRGVEILPLLIVSRWLNTSGVAANYVAAETLNGTSVQHITITPPNAPPAVSPDQTNFEQMARCEVYLDSTTNLPVRIRVYQHPSDRRASMLLDLDFSNYQSSGGSQFPFSITYSMDGQQIAQLQFQSIAVNAAVSANDFTWSAQ
jgi:hypothetical protein